LAQLHFDCGFLQQKEQKRQEEHKRETETAVSNRREEQSLQREETYVRQYVEGGECDFADNHFGRVQGPGSGVFFVDVEIAKGNTKSNLDSEQEKKNEKIKDREQAKTGKRRRDLVPLEKSYEPEKKE
jgi:hypothetical protein